MHWVILFLNFCKRANILLLCFFSLLFTRVHSQNNYYQSVQTIDWTRELLHSQRTHIVFFISPLCPLCQSYSLTFKQLMQTYHDTNLYCFTFIVPGPSFTESEIETFLKTYQMPVVRLIRDTSLAITHAFHAHTTPEVYVLSPGCKLSYYGRIDNWAFDLGRKRTQITSHELLDCLQSIHSGNRPIPSHQKAIGCFIE